MSHRIDALAYGNRLRWLPPGQKLAFAAVLLLLGLVAPPLVQGLISLWLALWIVVYAAIPARLYLPLLLLPLGFAIASLPALLLQAVPLDAFTATARGDVWQQLARPLAGGWMLYVSQQGVGQAALLISRSLAASSCLMFVLLTTPFSELIAVLRRLRLPPLLLELLVLTYGFIFTLMGIASELWVAQQARAGRRGWRQRLKSLGVLVAQLLHRSLASYRGLAMGLAARGFDGELRVLAAERHRGSPRHQREAIAGCALLGALSLGLGR
ncbi:cobalt ECF transporter T component CbiQ [Cyanobium sp. LEGE 06143]|uniref:cobalt ECF transporter T component CbiQ n=1 Tax=unclassified Cyanobium TaxID=2627006 RepID=UPI00187EEE82|nr:MULTISPECIES: cobalt ECF transporter T component CbiQ [unclassified Cyanobium]MBE9153584.1 cobalt ECF transporter T component CbiQ [Cyanobium sp. LEGE 06113]MBE9172264.1 cobalt ECF transporter T component CbiQ [Cyanobium sp. LEGE 06143]